MVTVSPHIGVLLSRIAETPDVETALLKVLSDYINLKLANLKQQIAIFESKWGMSFDEFSTRMDEGRLDKDSYSFEVENDFWEWESAETLLKHYISLRTGLV